MFEPRTAPQWKGTDTVDLVYRLNQRCFGLMSDAAGDKADPNPLPIVADYRSLWWMLDENAQRRAAKFPFVILDIRFRDAEWWKRALTDASSDGVRGKTEVGILSPLMHETLVLAWHTAKWDRKVARLSLGVTSAVADIIAALTPRDLATIADAYTQEVRLRWQDNGSFWRDILLAARNEDPTVLDELHLKAQLLLCGQLNVT